MLSQEMKLPQHINNNDAFDALVRQKLDEVNVDASLANKYWPVSNPPAPAGKFKIGKPIIFVSVSILLVVVALLWRNPTSTNNSSKNMKLNESPAVRLIVDSAERQSGKTDSSIGSVLNNQLDVITKPLPVKTPGSYGDTAALNNNQSHITPNNTQVQQVISYYDSVPKMLNTTLPPKLDTSALIQVENKKVDTLKKKAPYIIW